MSVLEILRKDHQKVLARLKTAENFARHIETNNHLNLNKFNAIVDSILGYFTGELRTREKVILSSLESTDFGAVKTQFLLELEAEDKACHELLKNISRQIEPPIAEVDTLKKRLVENLWTVIELRRRHIEKVQQRVFPFLEGYSPKPKTTKPSNLGLFQERVNFR